MGLDPAQFEWDFFIKNSPTSIKDQYIFPFYLD